MSGKVVTLEDEQVVAIRRALLIGLSSFGEIERLNDRCFAMKLCGGEVPEGLTPIHPTGCSDTIGEFATALQFLE